MTSSFKKATKVKTPDIPGTRISIENSQLLISTGAPDFDAVIGGGLAVGTLLVIAEDANGSYAKLLAKLFMAEGVAVGHPLFIASQDVNPEKLMQEVPPVATVASRSEKVNKNELKEDELKIAWRYQNIPTGGPNELSNVKFGHHFDLSQTIPSDLIKAIKPVYWNSLDTNNEEQHSFEKLLDDIKNKISENNLWIGVSGKSGQQSPSTVLRIIIHSLGSPLWRNTEEQLTKMLYCLKAIIRSSCAVCVVTLPTNLIKKEILYRCIHISDYGVQPIPAQHIDGKTPSLLTGMDGVFKILRLSAINCLMPYIPSTFDLGFKVRRKKFSVEKLQLPPELTESAEREQDDIGVPMNASGGCGSTSGNKKLEF